MNTTKLALASLVTLLFIGCGSSSSSNSNTDVNLTSSLDLPDGKILIFFDNATSDQYLYDTTADTNTNMNTDVNKTYNMTDKTGKLIRWDHETTTGVDQKIVMINDDFNINEGNLTYNDFHYLGHFHEEDNVHVFASHSNSEFDPTVSSDAKKATLVSLNTHLLEQEAIKQEIATTLADAGEELCNFYVLEHEEEDAATETEEDHGDSPHFAFTKSGKVHVYYDEEGGLTLGGDIVALEGVTSCEEDKSSIVKNNDHGVLIFSAETQTLYQVDTHDEINGTTRPDYHQHANWTGSKFLPTNFTPTQFVGIGESDEAHDD
ncbi:MAG: Unknown protein [uncultured Sulfurovum sp.]|uniref:Uncharacterized protein n=1 Tax=uncultured Sulfurovum sp. TaxID=269237 RepID=A0A6S6TXN9_9BACT|nr:MAG: Unknown protein [uncultured Sulfurovum sp.]